MKKIMNFENCYLDLSD